MAFLLGFVVIALVMLVVVLAVAAALVRTLLLPLLAGVGAGLIAAAGGIGHPLAIGFLAGFLVLLAGRRRRSAARIRAVRMREMREGTGAVTIEGRAVSAPADPLADSWSRARRLATGHRRRLDAAHAAGIALIAESEAAPLDLELHEAAMLLTRHAPDLIARAEALCAADPGARRACVEQMVAALEELTGVTGAVGERRRGRLHDAFATVRRHVADRTGARS